MSPPAESLVDVLEAEFVTSLPKWHVDAVGDLPQFCFAGRSNVGKSSLLNCLVARKALARTSNTPGRTQAINVFRILLRRGEERRTAHFVDLPGYGFAKAPKSVSSQWGAMMQGYLRRNPYLRGAVLLLDLRHAPTDLDRQMLAYLAAEQVPLMPVATKSDKVARNQRPRHLQTVAHGLELAPRDVLLFSSETREGRDELLGEIWDAAEPPPAPDNENAPA